MKVLAVNGSPRKSGNTSLMLRQLFDVLESHSLDCELVNLAGERVAGCGACYGCFERKDRKCVKGNDIVNSCILKMLESDAIVLASPTYVADITPELKALIDRACIVAKANGDMFKRKVGAAVVAKRRGGAIHAFNSINHFFLIGQMIVPGSCYWNMGIGGMEMGDVKNDEEGLKTMDILGENIAWLLKKIGSQES